MALRGAMDGSGNGVSGGVRSQTEFANEVKPNQRRAIRPANRKCSELEICFHSRGGHVTMWPSKSASDPFAHSRNERRMATLVYKMTHKGDPDSDLGWWGVKDCMGQVRSFPFGAVIGIGGRSWWKNQISRVGEIVWVGLEPDKMPIRGKRPKVRFAHFRYFCEGELLLSKIARELDKAMQSCRFKLYDFSRVEEQEIEKILALARKAGHSAAFFTQPTKKQVNGLECRPKPHPDGTRFTKP